MAKIKRAGKNILNIFKGRDTTNVQSEFITENEKQILRKQIATEYHLFF